MRFSVLLLLLVSNIAFGQMENYDYQRKLEGINNQWHRIELPDALFSKVNNSLSDIRLIGITSTNDTIEAPYFLKILEEEIEIRDDVKFNLLNSSKKDGHQYITFVISNNKKINEIYFKLEEKNYDYKIKLEGGNNQSDWYTINDNLRILSIDNNKIYYNYSDLIFPESQYKYYRISYKSEKKLEINEVHVRLFKEKKSKLNAQEATFNVKQDKKSKKTIIDINLKNDRSISKVQLDVKNYFDYYRPMIVENISKPTIINNQVQYYDNVYDGVLSSLSESTILFGNRKNGSIRTKHLRVTIDNQNNQPLEIKNAEVYSYQHELIARFTEPATYHLVYGNRQARTPNYDIEKFKNKIPEELGSLQLGAEINIKTPIIQKSKQKPLFENKAWLWALMVVIIVTLGWFSFKMIKQKETE